MAFRKYDVKVTFKFPAWDEKEGFTVQVYARTKAEANKRARRMIEDDGHRNVTLRATEAEVEAEAEAEVEVEAE